MGVCLVLPLQPLPPLPPGISFSFALPIPAFPDQPDFCCKVPDLVKYVKSKLPIIPNPLFKTPVVGAAALKKLNDYITTANEYLRSIPLNCPLE